MMRRRIPLIERLAAIPPFWRLVISLLVAVMLLGAWLLVFVDTMLVSGEGLPIALHSPLDADYSADAVAFIPAARINLLSEAIADQAQEGTNAPAEQLATMVDQMRTPVFTVTPYPGMTSVPGTVPAQERATNTPSVPDLTLAVPTGTGAVPTAVPSTTVLAPSVTPTATWNFTRTATPGAFFPTATRTATYPPVVITDLPTRVPPTQTLVPPTRTPVPQQPTQTPVPSTQTPIPRPTDTPVPPPTDTPVPTTPPYPPPGTDYP